MDIQYSPLKQGVIIPGQGSQVHAELSEQVAEEMDARKKDKKQAVHQQASVVQSIVREPVRVQKKDRDKNDSRSQESENPYEEPELSFDDTVELTRIQWKQTSSGDVDIDPDIEHPIVSSVDLKYDAKEILRSKGHEINFLGQLPRLKQSFIQNYIQSKSSSLLVSKYGAFKVGIIGQSLSVLGVSSEDILQLKKKAHQQAIQENIEMMGETLYNLELMELVHGVSRKTKKSRQLLMETQNKLIGQMNALGRGDYWDEARLLEGKIQQLSVIEEEFNRDYRALLYQYEFMSQDVNS